MIGWKIILACSVQYDLAEIVRISYPSAFSTKNISGLQNNGIFPLNRNVFDKHDDFLVCVPTDSPDPLANIKTTTIQMPISQMSISNAVDSVPSTSSASNSLSSTSNSKRRAKVSSEKIRPLPKAGPRTSGQEVDNEDKPLFLQ